MGSNTIDDNEILYISLKSWLNLRTQYHLEYDVFGSSTLFRDALVNQIALLRKEDHPDPHDLVHTLHDTGLFCCDGSYVVNELMKKAVKNMVGIPEREKARATKKWVMSRECPQGAKDVSDHVVFFHLHGDGFQAYDRYAKSIKSFYAVSLRCENVNSYDASSLFFTRFLTILPEVKEKLFHKLSFVLQLLCDIGLEGVYFLKNGVCRHYSFAIDNICGDVIAQQDMCGQSGKLASQFPCIHGNCQKWRFNPLLYDFEQFSSPSTFSKARGWVDCSPPFQFSSRYDFLNNLSLVANLPAATTVSRLVDSIRDSLKGTASDFSSDESFQRVLVDQLESLRCFLGLLQSDRAVFWKRSLLSLKKNIHDRVNALQSVTRTGRFPSSEEQRRNALDELATKTDPISTALFSSMVSDPVIIKMIGKNDDEVKKESPIDFKACFGNDAGSMMILDFMHLISNFTYRIICYVNGELPTPAVRASLTSFFEHLGVAFPDAWKMKRDLRDGLLLPQEVLMCAIRRCGEFAEGEYGSVCPWVQKEILIPSCFKTLTCEQKMKFAFFLFDWVFQDSLGHPFVMACKESFDLLCRVLM